MQVNHDILFSTVQADDSREKCQPSRSLLLSNFLIWRCQNLLLRHGKGLRYCARQQPKFPKTRSEVEEQAAIGEIAAVGGQPW